MLQLFRLLPKSPEETWECWGKKYRRSDAGGPVGSSTSQGLSLSKGRTPMEPGIENCRGFFVLEKQKCLYRGG